MLSRPAACGRTFFFVLMLGLAGCGGGGGGGGGGTASGGTTTPAQPAVPPPVIKTQPVSQSVVPGESVMFFITYDDAGIQGVQWQRDGKDIPGATRGTYFLNSPQASDNGSVFTVVLTGAGGSTTSAPATLTVSVSKGVAFVAGSLGGIGNQDGPDGRLTYPVLLAMHPSGLLYVLDHQLLDGPLRTVDLATGTLTTLTGIVPSMTALVYDGAGNRYDATNTVGNTRVIYRTTPDGQRTVFAGAAGQSGSVDGSGASARFTSIDAMAADGAGNLYVADGGTKLRKVSPSGTVTTLAGGGPQGPQNTGVDGAGSAASFVAMNSLAVDRDGNVAVIDGGRLRRVSPSGAVTTPALTFADGAFPNFNGTASLAFDPAGNINVLTSEAPRGVRRIAPDGTVTLLANVTPATSYVAFTNLVSDNAGNLYVGDNVGGIIRRIAPTGTVTTIAGRAAVQGNVDGAGAAAQFMPQLSPKYELVTDSAGNVYVGEGDRVRKVSRNGDVSTLPRAISPLPNPVPDGTYYPSSLAVDGTVLQVGFAGILRVDATGAARVVFPSENASLPSFTRLVEDGLGNIYLQELVKDPSASSGLKAHVRKVAPDGTMTTLPLDDASILHWCADKQGRLWIDEGTKGITRLDPDGTRTIVYGWLSSRIPTAMAVDRNGNLYVAVIEDPLLYSVHKVTPSGVDTVIAGTAGAYGVRLGAPGSLGLIDAITVADDGTVYVMSENAVLRLVQ